MNWQYTAREHILPFSYTNGTFLPLKDTFMGQLWEKHTIKVEQVRRKPELFSLPLQYNCTPDYGGDKYPHELVKYPNFNI
ncbi:hypothetical protein ACVWYN_002902 [Pedobacter sp. UYP24]